jgi:ribosomal protein S18 acetylase RimI-like enzyme
MMSSSDRFLIRPFRPADREPLDELWTRVFPDDPTWNAPAVIIENKLKVQPELLLIGELDGTIVGALMAGFDGVRGWLYHLAVAPEFRRRGFATGLVRAAEDRLRKLGWSIFRSVPRIMTLSPSTEA